MRNLMKLVQLINETPRVLRVRAEKLTTRAFPEKERNNTIMHGQLTDLFVEA